MLQSIHIQNYALIEELDIDFHAGFSVITGETGAGKSIILGAIGLLLGQRADIKAIRNGATKCVVEARFNVSSYQLESFFEEYDLEFDPTECILRRELHASGKSRAFVNDSPVTINQMKMLGEKLVDVHSQHQNLLLNHEDFQIGVLDILADDEHELNEYKSTFKTYRKLIQELDEIKNQVEKFHRDEDYIRYQMEQLDNAGLVEDEQEHLEQEADTLRHAEDIKSSLYKVDQLMCGDDKGVISSVKESIQALQSLSRVYPPSQEWVERLSGCYVELKDLSHELSCAQDEVEYNPTRLESINDRLNLIYSLQQKHHVSTLKELMAVAEDYRAQLERIASYDDHIKELELQIAEIHKDLMVRAKRLSQLRTKAARQMEKQMVELLIPLGMPYVQFSVEFAPRKELDINGMDSINFLFSANKNVALQNVASTASGGEIARVMLSLKALITGAVNLPTIIFDEIDTGVSGSIAEKMAMIMQQMGKSNRQVISITHLPQIAAKGSNHYKVYKQDTEEGTQSYIRQLNEKERINEIAYMLSGTVLTDAALNNARVLLNSESL